LLLLLTEKNNNFGIPVQIFDCASLVTGSKGLQSTNKLRKLHT